GALRQRGATMASASEHLCRVCLNELRDVPISATLELCNGGGTLMAKKIKDGQTHITLRVIGRPDISEKIIQRSYVRTGVVAGGTSRVRWGASAQRRTSKSST